MGGHSGGGGRAGRGGGGAGGGLNAYDSVDPVEPMLDYSDPADMMSFSALNAYVTGGHRDINDELLTTGRGNYAIDRILNKASTPNDTVVYRGIDHIITKDFKKGETYIHKPYMSTSDRMATAKGFSKPSFVSEGDKLAYQYHVMEVKMPKGTKAVSMKGISPHKEREVLVSHHQKLKMTGSKTAGDTVIYKFNLIP